MMILLLLLVIQLNVLIAIDINDIMNTTNVSKTIDHCNINIPVIDISTLKTAIMYSDKNKNVIKDIRAACTDIGFFYISNHGVPDYLINYLEKLSREFFALDKDVKKEISMDKGGHAWRGYFAVGEEVTSGIPDQKEGIYFGTEGDPEDMRPLHGVNLYPNDDIKEAVETYMQYMKQLGETLMKAIVLSLGLDYSFVDINFQEPTELFRIFGYPPHDSTYGENSHAVGTHSDYGYLTILYQDKSGGLQVKPKGCSRKDHWINAPPIEGTFVINLGDSLEHFTGGYYTSTPHRVIQRLDTDNLRISMPYFYDPNFDTQMSSVLPKLSDEIQKSVSARRKLGELSANQRWDNSDPTQFQGTYGDYLKNKISKVFPHLYNAKIKAGKEKDIKSRLFNLLNKEEVVPTKQEQIHETIVESTAIVETSDVVVKGEVIDVGDVVLEKMTNDIILMAESVNIIQPETTINIGIEEISIPVEAEINASHNNEDSITSKEELPSYESETTTSNIDSIVSE